MKFKNYKLKASAMQFAILLSAIVSIILSCFLLLTSTFQSFEDKSQNGLNNMNVANMGISHILNLPFSKDTVETTIQNTSVKIKTEYWGSFEKVTSKAIGNSSSFEKIALVGSILNTQPNFYLEDNNLPLVLAGDSHIEGEVKIPGNRIKAGNISGNYYNGKKLIYGSKSPSLHQLPKLQEEWKKYIVRHLNFSPIEPEILIDAGNYNNSFYNHKNITIYKDASITITQKLKGEVTVISEKEIKISSLAHLDQVLLLAPTITVEKGFEGRLHAIANKITVEEGVRLNYPSSLVVQKKTPDSEINKNSIGPSLTIGKNCSIGGNVVFLEDGHPGKPRIDVLVDDNSTVIGSVYVEGYLENRGVLKGNTYCKFVIANQDGSLYINHLYNSQITPINPKANLDGILLDKTSKGIAQWLY